MENPARQYMTYLNLHNTAQLRLHIMSPSRAISLKPASGLDRLSCQSDEKDPPAEILPGHWIRLQMDQVNRGLSSPPVQTLADRHHREKKSIPGPSSTDSIPAQSIDRKMDGRDG